MDPADLTATAARAELAAGRLTPPALMEACLARVAAREGTLQAMAWLDPAQARAGAAAAREGALHGLPLGVKDVLDTADVPTGYGSPIWAGHRPRADAAAVAWARAAGAVVLGKTVTTEFATRQPGATTNPHKAGHTPGGSSSGSAAGVAAGYFPFAYGTQTAGSVIRPAAYCGVVGYKPSYGMIERHGMKLMAFSLDTIGVMARSVADCALLAGAVSGRALSGRALDGSALDGWGRDGAGSRAWRIGVCESPAWEQADAATQALLHDVAGRLGRAGAQVGVCTLPPLYAQVLAEHAVVMNAQSARAMGWELGSHADQLSAGLRERLEWGLSQPPGAVDAALGVFERARSGFAEAMAGYDVLLTRLRRGEAPAGLGWTGDPVFNSLWTALHVPCVTVPAGVGPGGLPLGVQIVGGLGADAAVLAAADWVSGVLAERGAG